jgi:signal transduction histidine kinase/ActR/RegA family two-component response regulator
VPATNLWIGHVPGHSLDKYLQYPVTAYSSDLDYAGLQKADGILLFNTDKKMTHILPVKHLGQNLSYIKLPLLELGALPLVIPGGQATVKEVQKEMATHDRAFALIQSEQGEPVIISSLDLLSFLANQAEGVSSRLLKEQEEHFNFVIHDIKEPLTVLNYAVQKMSDSGKLDPEQKKLLTKMSVNTERLLSLTEDLSLASKVKQSPGSISVNKRNIRDYLTELTPTLQDLASVRNMKFAVGDMVDGEILMNKKTLTRCLVNLVENAVKYGNSGDTIRLLTRFEGRENETWLRVIITDQGIGIPENRLKEIFSSYYQLNAESALSGVGLGLTIASKFAEAHGGRLEVTNNEGTPGSTFMLVLPNAFPKTKPVATPPPKKSYSVLVVDDDPEILNYLAKEVEKLGHFIMTAGNGAVALECFRKFKPEIVITDIRMPGMDGIQLLQEIRQADKNVHVYLLSGKFNKQDSERILAESKAAGYLHKPFEPRQLATILAQVGSATKQ